MEAVLGAVKQFNKQFENAYYYCEKGYATAKDGYLSDVVVYIWNFVFDTLEDKDIAYNGIKAIFETFGMVGNWHPAETERITCPFKAGE